MGNPVKPARVPLGEPGHNGELQIPADADAADVAAHHRAAEHVQRHNRRAGAPDQPSSLHPRV
jgi:hypothetical protein